MNNKDKNSTLIYAEKDYVTDKINLRKRRRKIKRNNIFLIILLFFVIFISLFVIFKSMEQNEITETTNSKGQITQGDTEVSATEAIEPVSTVVPSTIPDEPPSPKPTISSSPTQTISPTTSSTQKPEPTSAPIPSASLTTIVEPTPEPTTEVSVDGGKFATIYYYEADKQQRYESYQKRYPDMDAGDVVWKVNSNLDKDWYAADIPVNGYDDPYIIVNKYYKVPDGYKPPDLVKADGLLMRKATADAYLKMKNDAAAQGFNIRAVSAYRTVDYQRGLYNKYLAKDSKANVDRYSARPGYSEHHTGMALDLFGSQDGLRNFVNTPEYIWVRDNGHKYGFIIRYWADIEDVTGYEDEPWHIRYVGTEVSTDMRNKDIKSFEEYHVKYIRH